MNRALRVPLLCLALLVSGAVLLRAAEDHSPAEDLIAKAREHLGGEEKLKSIQSLRYEGTIEFFETATKAKVVIALQKPAFQRMEVHLPEGTQIVAVDDLQGWEMLIDRSEDPPKEVARYLSAREFWRNHFSAVENLGFHHGYLVDRGRLEWKGEQVIDGRLVGTMEIRYDANNRFSRSFDVETGALVRSIGNDGTEVRERTWMEVEGIRFPRVSEYFRDGKRTSRLTFEKIEVNPRLDPALFRYPVL
jgi:outer membrane lipoprotein-sorting protein